MNTTSIWKNFWDLKAEGYFEKEKNNPQEIVIKPEILDTSALEEGESFHLFRPDKFSQYIGQDKAKKHIQCYIDGCKKFGEPFPNTFLSSPAGCFKAGTKILMYDYTLKNIEDIKIGDIVLSFDEKPKNKISKRKFKPSVVTHLHKRISKGLVYLKSNRNEVWTTNEHPFLTYGLTSKYNRFIKANRLFAQHSFLNFPQFEQNKDFKLGWLLGFNMADGSLVNTLLHFYNKDKYILQRLKLYLKDLYELKPRSITKYNEVIQISIHSKLIANIFKQILKNLKNRKKIYSTDLLRGIISGFFDGDGSIVKKNNNPQHAVLINTNKIYIQILQFILNELNFKYKTYIKKQKSRYIKNTKYKSKKRKLYHLHVFDLQKFYCTFQPSIKKIFYGKITGQQEFQKLLVKKIFRRQDFKPSKLDFTVYNLTTSAGTYIANGFPVHNCGKTLLANILANKLGKTFVTSTAGEIKSEQILVDKIAECKGGVLFLDEAHRIGNKLGTFLLPILDEYKISGRKINHFTMIFASTHRGNLSENLSALLQRFPLTIKLEQYKEQDIIKILDQFHQKSYPSISIDKELYFKIAKNCKSTPRIAINLLRESIFSEDWELVKSQNKIVKDGFTQQDISALKFILNSNGASKLSIAKFLRVEPKTYEFEIENFLINQEMITVSNKRKITEKGKGFLKEIN